ncbi:MAG: hypothetical protein ACTHLB_13110 [Parafilimonas sp.]
MKYNLLFLLMTCVACNNDGSETNNGADTIKDYDTGTSSPAETISECYENINGKDTVFLSIFSQSKVITGSLVYNYYEKDKNSGTIKGNMYGDTLIADYIFSSEGITSTREVAFLKRESAFIEGYGDMREEGGKMVFTNRSSLSFSGKPLRMVNCKEE